MASPFPLRTRAVGALKAVARRKAPFMSVHLPRVRADVTRRCVAMECPHQEPSSFHLAICESGKRERSAAKVGPSEFVLH